jgi:hypothetical protein
MAVAQEERFSARNMTPVFFWGIVDLRNIYEPFLILDAGLSMGVWGIAR